MKGILKKTEEGWFVVFDQRTMQDPSAEEGILPLHPIDVKMIDEDSKVFDHIEARIKAYPNVEFEVNMYDGKSHISNAWNGYAKLVATDENGKPLTYWGGLKDRTCDHTNCREVCPECKPYHVSEDCEEVKNWDNFVEQKNLELLAEEVYGKGIKPDYEEGFIDGYNKAKETLYTEEQIREAIKMAYEFGQAGHFIGEGDLCIKEIIQSLKKD